MRLFKNMKLSYKKKNKEVGFSLVELMVALVIGLIIVLGAGQLYITSKRTYDQMAEMGTRQQSLRALVDFISLDVRTASAIDEVNGSTLSLSYDVGTRDADPYCSGTGALSAVKYSLSDASMQIEVGCDGAALQSPENLIDGVSGVSFDSPSPFYVAVEVTFDTMQGEPDENSVYSFFIARRGEIL